MTWEQYFGLALLAIVVGLNFVSYRRLRLQLRILRVWLDMQHEDQQAAFLRLDRRLTRERRELSDDWYECYTALKEDVQQCQAALEELQPDDAEPAITET